jgi:hypothetical protein
MTSAAQGPLPFSLTGSGIVLYPFLAGLLLVGLRAAWICVESKSVSWLTCAKGQANYDFGKSWASTLTVVGALLGTMLTAGVLTNADRKAEFASLNAVFLMLSLVAPLAYSAAAARPAADRAEGTMLALLIASGITLWAVFGQLATMGLLIDELHANDRLSSDLRTLFSWLLWAAALLMAVYAWRALYALAKPCLSQLPGAEAGAALPPPWSLL